MENAVFVTKGGAFEELIHKTTDRHWVESTTIAVRIHILLEVLLAILEYKDQFGLGVNDIVKADDVLMFELLHEGNLADSSGRSTLLSVQMDFLESDDFIRGPGPPLLK